MTLDRDSYLAALHRDGLAFGELCAAANMTTAMPSCPRWSLGDLVAHLTSAHHFWATVVHERITRPSAVEPAPRAHDTELVDAYRASFDHLLTVLNGADDQTQVWTWSARGSSIDGTHVVRRRIVHETAVHVWDAADAVGRRVAIEAVLASDGIDEFLTRFQRGVPAAGDPSVHLHCTDVAGEWTLRPGDGVYEVSREHAKGDVAMRGSASDLLLVLWERLPLDSIDLLGDRDHAAQFLGRFVRG